MNTASAPIDDLFFSNQMEPQSVLWLPPTEVHSFSQKVDWLSGLSVSSLIFREKKKWSTTLSEIINTEDLKIDQTLDVEKSTLIKLPQGFKCAFGLIIDDCSWNSPEEVFSSYSKVSKKLKPNLTQSPYIWKSNPSQLLKEIQWIKI